MQRVTTISEHKQPSHVCRYDTHVDYFTYLPVVTLRPAILAGDATQVLHGGPYGAASFPAHEKHNIFELLCENPLTGSGSFRCTFTAPCLLPCLPHLGILPVNFPLALTQRSLRHGKPNPPTSEPWTEQRLNCNVIHARAESDCECNHSYKPWAKHPPLHVAIASTQVDVAPQHIDSAPFLGSFVCRQNFGTQRHGFLHIVGLGKRIGYGVWDECGQLRNNIKRQHSSNSTLVLNRGPNPGIDFGTPNYAVPKRL